MRCEAELDSGGGEAFLLAGQQGQRAGRETPARCSRSAHAMIRFTRALGGRPGRYSITLGGAKASGNARRAG